MLTTTFIVSIIAIVLSVAALRNPGAAERRARLESAVRQAVEASEEAGSRAERVEQYLKILAEGREVQPQMIEEGRLFGEIDASSAQQMIESNSNGSLTVLDVRTQMEVQGGRVPGARWIPIDEIQHRVSEVPREGTVLVFCAHGIRSAAACDFLSRQGFTGMVNVSGGMAAYSGSLERS